MRLALYMLCALAFWWAGAVREDVACLALAVGMVVVGAAMVALARLSARGVTCRVRAEQPRARRGETARMTLTLENASRLPVGTFELTASVGWAGGQQQERALELAGTASARSELSVPLDVACPHCGLVRAQATSVTTHDPLGLVRVRMRPAQAAASVLVLPERRGGVRVVGCAELRDATSSTSAAAQAGGQEPPDVADVRAWRPGDALHSVHWKLSARSAGTMVKLYDQAPRMGLELRCNLDAHVDGDDNAQHKPTPDETDALLEAAADLSDALLAAGIPHRVSWGAGPACACDVTCPRDVDDCCCELVLRATTGSPSATDEPAPVSRETCNDAPCLDLDYTLKLTVNGRVIADLAPTSGDVRVVDLTGVTREACHES